MMEPRRLMLRYGEGLACELIAIVRDHHSTMPGAARDRPGWDRVVLQLPSGEQVIADVWSRAEQDIARAPRKLEVYDDGDLVCWRQAVPAVIEEAAMQATG